MSYITLRFDVDGANAAPWSDALLVAGALSVEVTDPRAGSADETPIYDEPGEVIQWWPIARVSALFQSEAQARASLESAAAALVASPPPFELYIVAEQDWVRATQAQFGPIRIDDGFWIVPSWCAPPDPGALNLALDPGVAFGTGSHPTTQLCLAWLRDHVTESAHVLDYGCGSGILAIAAARLGAGRVVGVDIDPQAVQAGIRNAARNDVAIEFCLVDALAPGQYELVIANILANPLVALAPVLAQRIRPGGRIALAGLLTAQSEEVSAAYARWFNIASWRERDGWVLLAGERLRA
jgi:ribosomal protein L11 methyltransferase